MKRRICFSVNRAAGPPRRQLIEKHRITIRNRFALISNDFKMKSVLIESIVDKTRLTWRDVEEVANAHSTNLMNAEYRELF
ncbi:hypothetical protein PUN28_001069 [Cardiocondyla obscurior]|uniref:Ribosomal protein L20 n=1 Tax=Cardiocondyla obscurior TaxID=286306 RepID=A0AAW2H3B0_9HYME